MEKLKFVIEKNAKKNNVALGDLCRKILDNNMIDGFTNAEDFFNYIYDKRPTNNLGACYRLKSSYTRTKKF